MRYPTPFLVLAAAFATGACSQADKVESGLTQAEAGSIGSAAEFAATAEDSMLQAQDTLPLRKPVWPQAAQPVPMESPAASLDVVEAAKPGSAHPSQFAPLTAKEQQALIAAANGPQRLHGYLFAGTDSESALAEHYQEMALVDVHRMYLDLTTLLPKVGKDGLAHAVNNWPLDAAAVEALKLEMKWLGNRKEALFTENSETLLAASMRTDWESEYLGMDSKALAYEIWLNQRLMGHEQGVTGRAGFFS